MALINEIKCARCDRKYSGVRSRCPYCGARRIGRGKYSEDSDNAKGKMLISILIMAVFTVAAGILLFTTPVDADAQNPGDAPAINNPEDDINSEPSIAPEPTPSPTPEPPDEPIAPLEVTSIIITYGGNTIRDNDFTQKKGEPIELGVRVEPVGIDEAVVWEGANVGDRDWEDVFEFAHVVGGVRLLGLETGTARLYARAGDKETFVTVRIN